MKYKRFSAFILAVLMILSFASCKSDSGDVSEETTVNANVQAEADKSPDVTEQMEDTNASEEETIQETEEETTATEDENETSVEKNTKKSDNPSDWTKAEIVDFYKNAAKKSDSAAKSKQSIMLKDISVNNGEYEGLFDFIMPIMSKLLANNSKENNGITGGYKNLAASDVVSAKAYKTGGNIAVEIVLKEQVSGSNDDAMGGSVGHAITAVGDIGAVVKQLKDLGLPLELSEKDTKIYYTNPTVKVVVDSNGKIVNGTWRYTVDINMNNYKAFGKTVDTTSVVMDNVITVNGGFKK